MATKTTTDARRHVSFTVSKTPLCDDEDETTREDFVAFCAMKIDASTTTTTTRKRTNEDNREASQKWAAAAAAAAAAAGKM